MSGLLKILYFGVFLGLMITGICGAQECSSDDILVHQIKTGKIVHGKQEFQVTLFNECPCPQSNVRLACKGFKSSEKVDQKVLVITEEICSLPVGSFIAPFSGYVFNYASNSEFPLQPIFSQVRCQ